MITCSCSKESLLKYIFMLIAIIVIVNILITVKKKYSNGITKEGFGIKDYWETDERENVSSKDVSLEYYYSEDLGKKYDKCEQLWKILQPRVDKDTLNASDINEINQQIKKVQCDKYHQDLFNLTNNVFPQIIRETAQNNSTVKDDNLFSITSPKDGKTTQKKNNKTKKDDTWFASDNKNDKSTGDFNWFEGDKKNDKSSSDDFNWFEGDNKNDKSSSDDFNWFEGDGEDDDDDEDTNDWVDKYL
tara:strand:+ start:371 stop:1105 length:735 start_codon:yes stop_codon:yes gene_type:complete